MCGFGSAFPFDECPDSDFYLMRIRIRIFFGTDQDADPDIYLMRMRIAKMMHIRIRIHTERATKNTEKG